MYGYVYYPYATANLSLNQPMKMMPQQTYITCYPMQMASPKGTDSFRTSILMLIDALEREPRQTYLISQVCTRFNFQRRRFYDVVNVLEAAGCCHKSSVDSFIWLGINNIKQGLTKLAKDNSINDPEKTLDDIFLSEDSVTISKLTQNFLLTFITLNKTILDIKQISTFLSRNNGRFKTTLCKLYQISHILEVAGIIGKTMVPGEVSLSERFFPDSISGHVKPKFQMLSIESLLNGGKQSIDIYENRWEQFTRSLDVSPIQSPVNTSSYEQMSL